jgi:hypothetical protein
VHNNGVSRDFATGIFFGGESQVLCRCLPTPSLIARAESDSVQASSFRLSLQPSSRFSVRTALSPAAIRDVFAARPFLASGLTANVLFHVIVQPSGARPSVPARRRVTRLCWPKRAAVQPQTASLGRALAVRPLRRLAALVAVPWAAAVLRLRVLRCARRIALLVASSSFFSRSRFCSLFSGFALSALVCDRLYRCGESDLLCSHSLSPFDFPSGSLVCILD